MLTLGADPTFFDIYLKYDNSSNLLPLPVLVSGSGANLERRFFLVDSVSALQSSSATGANVPKYIRYAKSINIQFELSSGKVNGQIYPPVFYITYGYASTANLQASVDVSFKISYTMNIAQEEVIVSIIIGVMTLLSFFWSIFRTWIWNKRSGKVAPDFVTLFKFFMFWCSALGNVLFIIMLALSLYWLIVYKGQTLAFVVVPQDYEEIPFVITLFVSFTLKLIDVIHLIFTQSSYDVFFIDWERPKVQSRLADEDDTNEPMLKSGVVARGGQKEKQMNQDVRDHNKISCWRMLFVANEWNELQTFRKINPTIQLIGVLFFLKVDLIYQY